MSTTNLSKLQRSVGSVNLGYKKDQTATEEAIEAPLGIWSILLRALLCPICVPVLFFYSLCVLKPKIEQIPDEENSDCSSEESEVHLRLPIHRQIYNYVFGIKNIVDVGEDDFNQQYQKFISDNANAVRDQRATLKPSSMSQISQDLAIYVARTDKMVCPYIGEWLEGLYYSIKEIRDMRIKAGGANPPQATLTAIEDEENDEDEMDEEEVEDDDGDDVAEEKLEGGEDEVVLAVIMAKDNCDDYHGDQAGDSVDDNMQLDLPPALSAVSDSHSNIKNSTVEVGNDDDDYDKGDGINIVLDDDDINQILIADSPSVTITHEDDNIIIPELSRTLDTGESYHYHNADSTASVHTATAAAPPKISPATMRPTVQIAGPPVKALLQALPVVMQSRRVVAPGYSNHDRNTQITGLNLEEEAMYNNQQQYMYGDMTADGGSCAGDSVSGRDNLRATRRQWPQGSPYDVLFRQTRDLHDLQDTQLLTRPAVTHAQQSGHYPSSPSSSPVAARRSPDKYPSYMAASLDDRDLMTSSYCNNNNIINNLDESSMSLLDDEGGTVTGGAAHANTMSTAAMSHASLEGANIVDYLILRYNHPREHLSSHPHNLNNTNHTSSNTNTNHSNSHHHYATSQAQGTASGRAQSASSYTQQQQQMQPQYYANNQQYQQYLGESVPQGDNYSDANSLMYGIVRPARTQSAGEVVMRSPYNSSNYQHNNNNPDHTGNEQQYANNQPFINYQPKQQQDQIYLQQPSSGSILIDESSLRRHEEPADARQYISSTISKALTVNVDVETGQPREDNNDDDHDNDPDYCHRLSLARAAD